MPVISRDQLIRLLQQARRFNNQIVRDAEQVMLWHLSVDRALEGTVGDDASERWNDASRVEQRKLVREVFGHGR